MLGLYEERYVGFTVKHFHEQLQKRHDYKLGYTVTRLALQGAGATGAATLGTPQKAATAGFCVEALNEAFARFGKPGIFNTDQGAQFTSDESTKMLRDHGIEISMDGRGRCHDNIFVERLWWTVKHEWVYLRPAANGIEQKRSLAEFFDWYNLRRPHQALRWRTPDEAYLGQLTTAAAQAA
jgi:transposase InsO family protein